MFQLYRNSAKIGLVGAIVAFPAFSRADFQERAEERVSVQTRSAEKLYDGEPLEVWRRRFSDIDPNSEYAAEYAAGLLEIVADRQARAAPHSLSHRTG